MHLLMSTPLERYDWELTMERFAQELQKNC